MTSTEKEEGHPVNLEEIDILSDASPIIKFAETMLGMEKPLSGFLRRQLQNWVQDALPDIQDRIQDMPPASSLISSTTRWYTNDPGNGITLVQTSGAGCESTLRIGYHLVEGKPETTSFSITQHSMNPGDSGRKFMEVSFIGNGKLTLDRGPEVTSEITS